MPNYRMVPGLVTEELDQEILVCDTDLAVVHRLSGPAAKVLRQVIATDAPVGLPDDEVTAGLVAAGVLVAADAPDREVGRRSFVRAAAAVSAIGVVTLALPRAAAASSGISESGGGGPIPEGEFFITTGTGGSTSIRLEWVTNGGFDDFSYDYVVRLDDDNSFITDGTALSGRVVTVFDSYENPGAVIRAEAESVNGVRRTKRAFA